MSKYIELDDASVAKAAYQVAWHSFVAFTGLTPDEKESAPRKLRQYIDALVSSGERDPEKIGHAALGLLREYEQITRSQARVTQSPSVVP
jgi:hypothetical protein